MSKLNNLRVLITGASSGIGEALAVELNKRGAIVILCARNEEELKRVQSRLNNKVSSSTMVYDVTNFNTAQKVVDEVIRQYGGLDILINNAGISQRSLAQDTSFEDKKKIIDINVLGVMAITKASLSHIIQSQGQIVVMNSVMGKINTKYRSAYAASKHALIGYFDSLRLEVEDLGVNILTILPGFIATNITKNAVGSTQDIIENSENNKGLTPGQFAEKAADAIESRKDEVYIGGFRERFAMIFKKFVPGLFNYFIKNQKVT
jgi:dehydrogenase/reductase SDR family protein 7B